MVFEKFILSKFCKNYNFFNKDYDFIFNSYYETISNFNSREHRGNLSRPTLKEVIEYRSHIEKHLDYLLNINSVELQNLIMIALNHEQQHQELILMDIKIFYFQTKQTYFYKKRNQIQA